MISNFPTQIFSLYRQIRSLGENCLEQQKALYAQRRELRKITHQLIEAIASLLKETGLAAPYNLHLNVDSDTTYVRWILDCYEQKFQPCADSKELAKFKPYFPPEQAIETEDLLREQFFIFFITRIITQELSLPSEDNEDRASLERRKIRERAYKNDVMLELLRIHLGRALSPEMLSFFIAQVEEELQNDQNNLSLFESILQNVLHIEKFSVLLNCDDSFARALTYRRLVSLILSAGKYGADQGYLANQLQGYVMLLIKNRSRFSSVSLLRQYIYNAIASSTVPCDKIAAKKFADEQLASCFKQIPQITLEQDCVFKELWPDRWTVLNEIKGFFSRLERVPLHSTIGWELEELIKSFENWKLDQQQAQNKYKIWTPSQQQLNKLLLELFAKTNDCLKYRETNGVFEENDYLAKLKKQASRLAASIPRSDCLSDWAAAQKNLVIYREQIEKEQAARIAREMAERATRMDSRIFSL